MHPTTTVETHPLLARGELTALAREAVATLRRGESPAPLVAALEGLGAVAAGAPAPVPTPEGGLVVATLLDDLLRRAMDAYAAEYHQLRTAVFGPAVAPPRVHVRPLTAPLFDRLDASAVAGCPHPGPWYPSSVDEVPCVVHGEEDGPLDCLRRLVQAHLGEALDRSGRVRTYPAGEGTLAEQARAAAVDGDGELPAGPHAVTATVWLGVATLACWEQAAPGLG